MDRVSVMQLPSKQSLDMLVKAFAEMEAAAKDANQNLLLLKETLLKVMEEEQIKTHEVQDGGKIYRATYTQATATLIDEEALREEMGDEVYLKYTVPVLNKKALEEAMEEGEVDPFVVGKHVTERKNKPSVRFSARAAADS